ncbi:MAG TPA: hypothetical protein VL360_04985 [Gammaproteobacteria bacterium]|jgi:hypothetical protein|nr:hypothetical protein [Gammaproteobacteria bacterium]
MRKIIAFVSILLAGSSVFAVSTLHSVGAAWKATQTTRLQPGHDINIVYGGEDVAQKPALINLTAVA